MRRLLLVPIVLFAMNPSAEEAAAVFAGGCFWCMEPPYDQLPGVLDTTSGYSGGHTRTPTYQQVTAGGTGHYEVVRVTYDPDRISYDELLAVFWRNIDPFDDRGQFCDRGSSYRAAVFFGSEAERELAEAAKADIETRFGRTVVTGILPAAPFYAAEGYHQNYYTENPLRYRYYRYRCGRDERLRQVWGDAAADVTPSS
ncbi:MAG: peptide-methionine (S)-S-oxide reductase MsrA [Gammaproteobacteria bacterium]|nr:peptide-methionine (S)-S-oxide reductase MsrA [Gammaproteobacteria bacterium]